MIFLKIIRKLIHMVLTHLSQKRGLDIIPPHYLVHLFPNVQLISLFHLFPLVPNRSQWQKTHIQAYICALLCGPRLVCALVCVPKLICVLLFSLYVLPNLYVRSYVGSSMLPNLYVRSYVGLSMLPNLCVRLYVHLSERLYELPNVQLRFLVFLLVLIRVWVLIQKVICAFFASGSYLSRPPNTKDFKQIRY